MHHTSLTHNKVLFCLCDTNPVGGRGWCKWKIIQNFKKCLLFFSPSFNKNKETLYLVVAVSLIMLIANFF